MWPADWLRFSGMSQRHVRGRHQSRSPQHRARKLGYAISQHKRKLIEQGFGWAKTVGNIRQVMVRGIERVDQMFVLTMAAYNLTRMRTLGRIRLQTV